MYSLNPTLIILSLFLILVWLIILTLLYFFSVKHYRTLTKGVGRADLKKALDGHLKKLEASTKDLDTLRKVVEEMGAKDIKHFQKHALVRFNPFGDTGGDQSFAMALLDEENNGVVISSLHGRAGTRIYGKPVKDGKEAGYQFSEEEKEAVEQAINQKSKIKNQK